MRSFWRAIRKALVNLANFFHLLLHMPLKGRYVPRSNTGMAREAMHVTSRGTSGTTAADKFLATELSKGHQIELHGDPSSSRPVVGYGGRAPEPQKRRSVLVTAVVILLLLSVLIVARLSPSVGWWLIGWD